jgi:eukaryotic-like serine/threonine-protein kinase
MHRAILAFIIATLSGLPRRADESCQNQHPVGKEIIGLCAGEVMEESTDQERVRGSTAPTSDVSRGSGAPKRTANAVQTPPPESNPVTPAPRFDDAAATILDVGSGLDAATMIELPHASEAPTVFEVPARRAASQAVSSPKAPASNWNSSFLLPAGSVLGNRYEILQLLGEGGMGAVYKARDTELDRLIGLKVIRPELASNPEILQRFKQELVLARQVTDRNIIRIFDLGEADGIRFITMEYVEGSSLHQMLRERGKFPVQESSEIIEQVLYGLKAAHREGVIHRDLKPANIMRDNQGRILVMDFGLARSIESDGMTKTGAVLGTMEYMSPEQAMGSELDPRSDLFTVGLILFEMLTGKMPFKADTAIASLLKRVQERAMPVSSVDNAVPPALEKIVAKCLERDLKLRYQTAQEMINDLDTFLGRPVAASSVIAAPPLVQAPGKKKLYLIAAAAAAVLIFAAGGIWYKSHIQPSSTSQQAPVSLLVGDFDNQTSDAIFDGTLEPAFNLALEGASFINSFSRTQAHTIGQQLKPGASGLDESLARLVAVREGVSVVLTGTVTKNGNGFRVESKAVDAVTGKTIASVDSDAENKQDVLRAVDKLAAHIRTALGDTTPESAQLAKAETFSTGSLEAAHEYAIAQDLSAADKVQESLSHYSRAIELDPDMGRAYAGMAAEVAGLGRNQEALKDYQMALARIDRMSDREKYRTRGGYYLLMREPSKAIEEYSALVKQFPFDNAGYSNLALAYFYRHDMNKAVEEGRHAVEISPKGVVARVNVALYAVYATDFATGAKEARAVLELDPGDAYAYRALALAQVGQEKINDAMGSYQKLATMGADNASVAALGLADIALYQGQASNASAILDKGIAADLAQKDTPSAAVKLVAMAYAEWLQGHNAQAVSVASRATSMTKDANLLYAAGQILVDAEQPAKALAIASQLSNSIESDSQLYGKLLEGEARLKRGEAKDAIRLFQAAQALSDTWLGHFDLGRGYLGAGLFTEADSEFEACLKRSGEASAVFLDDLPTFRLLPPVYYYLGRAQEGMKSPAAKDSYRKFVALQEQGTGPLLADARHRLTLN